MSISDRIRALIEILREEDLDEIEVRTWWSAVRVARRRPGGHPEAVPHAAASAAESRTAASVPAAAMPPEGPEPAATAAPEAEYERIVSPMVGTFYRSPSPEADPFVVEGSRVEVGQVLCIIEAMKLMNEIEAERGGVIRRILANDAQPVEFGQPLFLIE